MRFARGLSLACLAALDCGGSARSTKSPAPPQESPAKTEESPEWQAGEELDELAGVHAVGFEISAFYPSGGCEWKEGEAGLWFEGNREYGERVRELVPAPAPRATYYFDIRFRGRVSPPGSYGHLGAWKRKVEIVELIEMDLSERCASTGGLETYVSITDRVYFDVGSAEVPAQARAMLQSISATLAENQQIEAVIIKGHAAPGEPNRQELARARADAVASELSEAGVGQIELRPVAGPPGDVKGEPADRARRVEFELVPDRPVSR